MIILKKDVIFGLSEYLTIFPKKTVFLVTQNFLLQIPIKLYLIYEVFITAK